MDQTELESKIIRIQAAVDELSDLMVEELKMLQTHLQSGDVEWTLTKIQAMIQSITGDENG